MSRKRCSVEQIIKHLPEAVMLLSQGKTVGELCRRIDVSEQSYYRLRREYGGLKVPIKQPSTRVVVVAAKENPYAMTSAH